MTLGDLIETLASMPADYKVRFDNGRVPTELCSWRGVYAELTLDSDGGDARMFVGDLLKNAEEAVGKTFQGYKGGDYTMSRETPVWADEYGDYGCIGLMGARVSGDTVTLQTANLSDYR
jgi:hypothetical protein